MTVAELLHRTSSAELSEWMAYGRLASIGEDTGPSYKALKAPESKQIVAARLKTWLKSWG